MERGNHLWKLGIVAACAALAGTLSAAAVAGASSTSTSRAATSSASSPGTVVAGLDHEQVVSDVTSGLAAAGLNGSTARSGHAAHPHGFGANCTFNGVADTSTVPVTPGKLVNVVCTGFTADETVDVYEASPLILTSTTDPAYITSFVNEIDTTDVLRVPATGIGGLNVNFTIPAVFQAADKSAVCPPSQNQEDAGYLRCFLTVVGETSGNGDIGSLTYAGQSVAPQLPGYDEVASDGGVFTFNSPFLGSEGGKPLNKPIVGMAMDTITGGYYLVASDGGIFAFHAPFYGSEGGKPLNEPIVGMAFDPDTGGYYLVASDGGIFAFNAPFRGSQGGKPLNEPIVGMAYDPATLGYYLVASDGGVFSFHATFEGSQGGKPLNKPVVGMSFFRGFDQNGNLHLGYWLVASDGGIFGFPSGPLGPPFQGSEGGLPLNAPVVGMATDSLDGGYWEVASDGGIFSFPSGVAPFLGSEGGKPLNKPIVGISTNEVS
ncbi:MAG TPA: hypothetical protein VEJ87_06850 [Acidimicrobiales bacterium]|nr:hypothetical protein [Acidimicrobiales bacterium]